MSEEFWANMLRQVTPAPPPPPPTTTPAGAPWWAQPTYRPNYAAPTPPASPQPPPAAPHAPPTSRAKSARSSDRCPNCYSDNYFKASPNVAARCVECGWPIQHSTSGASITNTSTATSKPARHQPKGAGFNPGVIIGHA